MVLEPTEPFNDCHYLSLGLNLMPMCSLLQMPGVLLVQ
uniref:Uncharacterized protein n=1 Tax=Raoultella ornithinolytica TaxID=54291 RepID=A0A7U1DZR0_RAOOR|nr:hypothetical protein [Raoultella ornithinolytica]UHA83217.1 hypothetical protein OEHFJDOB_00273 [Klebsiella pneumoniae]UHA83837.1 hypothetical protein IPBHJEJL_00110 [Klebsiella oxytoca]UQW94591.1 hypothetical protein PCIJMNHK_00360 [Klebsiella variicola]